MLQSLHDNGFEAGDACDNLGYSLATFPELYKAWITGFDSLCSYGYVSVTGGEALAWLNSWFGHHFMLHPCQVWIVT